MNLMITAMPFYHKKLVLFHFFKKLRECIFITLLKKFIFCLYTWSTFFLGTEISFNSFFEDFYKHCSAAFKGLLADSYKFQDTVIRQLTQKFHF